MSLFPILNAINVESKRGRHIKHCGEQQTSDGDEGVGH